MPNPNPDETAYDPDFGKPRVPPKLPQRIPQGASHDFARGQRNVPTEAVPQKEIPTAKIAPRGKPTPGAKTEVLSSGKSGPAPRASSPTEIRGPRAPVRTIKPGSPEGLERTAQKIPQEVAQEAQAAARQMGKSGIWSKIKPRLKGIGVAGLVGIAIGLIGFGIFEYATNEALKKMGPDADLSSLLPSANKVIWITAPFTRVSRDESAPDYEPNVFAEEVTITPPESGILAFGISLEGLPADFTNSININDLGEGNSDWLCQPFGGYLVCRSTSRGYPLMKDLKNIVSMQFHLPDYELQQYLQVPSGSRSVYLIVR